VICKDGVLTVLVVLKLKDLFLEMIRSPYKYVAPEQELTRLTLMTSTAAENIRRRSTIGGSRPLGTINGLALLGPLIPPSDENRADSNDQPMLSPSPDDGTSGHQISGLLGQEVNGISESAPVLGTPDAEMDATEDNSSEVTLISTPSVDDSVMIDGGSKPEPQRDFSNKDNLPPPKAHDKAGSNTATEEKAIPLADHVASEIDANNKATAALGQQQSAKDASTDSIPVEPSSRPPAVPPRPLPTLQQDHTLEEYARQQDVTEVLNHVLFQLSCAIKPLGFDEEGEQIDQIKDLFYGRTKQHIMSDDKDEAKNDRFCSIIVRLFLLPHDIYAALDGYFDVEEIANKKRFLSISRLPPIFQIQIDRAGLDQKKNNHHVELKETIYLDRYLEEDTNAALMERRQEAWIWKKELADLQARLLELTADQSHADAQTAFQDARIALMYLQELDSTGEQGLEVPASAVVTLEALWEQTRFELQEIMSRSKDLSTNINSQFADSAFRRHAYRLHAAFFHHGTASSGHYWIYIYDFRKEMWLKYNDTRVEEVKDTNEIFRRPSEAEFGQWNGPSNPYYLVYVRDEDKDKLVESVCRDVQLPAVEPTRDIEMADVVVGAADIGDAGNAQSEPSASVPLALRERVNPSGEWDSSEANLYAKW
jgi:ubiquitin carboxyl-terminal hydrolase 25